MTVTVNGEKKELPPGASVRDLVEALDLKGRAVAVELNRSVVPRRQHESTPLKDGDMVEVVTLVGGG